MSHALAEYASSCASSRVPSVEAPDGTSCGHAEPQGHHAAPAAALSAPECVPDGAAHCGPALTSGAPGGGYGAAAGKPVSREQEAPAGAAPGELQTPQAAGKAGSLVADVCGAAGLIEMDVQVCCICFKGSHSQCLPPSVLKLSDCRIPCYVPVLWGLR